MALREILPCAHLPFSICLASHEGAFPILHESRLLLISIFEFGSCPSQTLCPNPSVSLRRRLEDQNFSFCL